MISSSTSLDRPFLQVNDLAVAFPTEDGLVRAVDGVSLSLEKGSTLAIVGESGSGKSVTAQAIMGLVNKKAAQVSGEIWLDGQELIGLPADEVQALRGSEVAMIFQDPMSSLHPFYRIGDQIVEAIRAHRSVGRAAARREVLEMLRHVGIPAVERRIDAYPHQRSGGMRQRVMIAMALINSPALLIADEPTTALDVTVQAQILHLLKDLQKEFGSAIIIITHDLGVVAEVADDILVMYAGKAVERGPVDEVFYNPQHPYAWGLLSSMPRIDKARQERLHPIRGNPPSLINPPSGCAFHPRCDFTSEVPGDACRTDVPFFDVNATHPVRCHIEPKRRQELFENTIKPRL
jgi:peptide/nickel transport system ATP-binding protein